MDGMPSHAIVVTSPEPNGITFSVGPVFTQVDPATNIFADARPKWPTSLKL
jgi:hypothetical protein